MALDEFRGLAENPDEVELAPWFHDAVYVPTGSFSEARSADLAGRVLGEAGVPEDVGERVAGLILATRHEKLPSEPDAMLVADIDLVGLGADPAVFSENGRRIREEYREVPEDAFRDGQARLFGRLLSRPGIYAAPQLGSRYEARARRSLERHLER